MTQHLAPGRILHMNVGAHAMHCLSFVFLPYGSSKASLIGTGDSISEKN